MIWGMGENLKGSPSPETLPETGEGPDASSSFTSLHSGTDIPLRSEQNHCGVTSSRLLTIAGAHLPLTSQEGSYSLYVVLSEVVGGMGWKSCGH